VCVDAIVCVCVDGYVCACAWVLCVRVCVCERTSGREKECECRLVDRRGCACEYVRVRVCVRLGASVRAYVYVCERETMCAYFFVCLCLCWCLCLSLCTCGACGLCVYAVVYSFLCANVSKIVRVREHTHILSRGVLAAHVHANLQCFCSLAGSPGFLENAGNHAKKVFFYRFPAHIF